MVILVPGKPVALVLGLLNASILSAISHQRICAAEKIPSLSARGIWQPAAADHAKRHSTSSIPNRESQRIGSPINRRDCLNEHNRLMASECVGQE